MPWLPTVSPSNGRRSISQIPIKSVGVHAVALNLHAEVAVSINVNVARSEDEAARQSAGEDVTVTQYEADEDGDFAAGQKDAQQDDRFDDEV